MPVVIDLERRGNAALVSRAAALRAQGAAPQYEHCARALQQGQAEALVAFARGTRVDATGLLAVRVERQRGEYWAKWHARVA